jgi:ABC-type nickel/cobalt efflux system permease component RcnA
LRFVSIVIFAGLLLTQASRPAFAHPLGNYSINQYFLVDLRGERPDIYYLLDLAEIPSFGELDLIDPDFDSEVSPEEERSYLDAKTSGLVKGIRFSHAGRQAPLELVSRRLALAEGSANMVVINILVQLAPESFNWPAANQDLNFEIVSGNFRNAIGVRECKVLVDGRYVDQTPALGRSVLEYQTRILLDQGVNPVYQDFDAQFRFSFRPGGGTRTARSQRPPGFGWTATARTARDMGDRLMESAFGEVYEKLLPEESRGESAPEAPPVLRGVSPAEMIQPAGRLEKGDEAFSGWLDRISETVRSRELTPFMFITGLVISVFLGMVHARTPGHGKTVMAAYLIGERGTVRHAILLGTVVTITHTWSVILLGLVTLYFREQVSEERLSFWLGIGSGLIIAAIGVTLFLRRYAAFTLARRHERDEHAHGPEDHHHGHSHVVRAKDGKPPSYRAMLGLGVSGGIVPCPTALIVLLLAIRFGRLGYGLCLILAFSLGLALVLIALGIVVVRASHTLERWTGKGQRLQLISAISSAAIIVLGLWVVVWTLMQHKVIVFMPGG